MDIEQIWNQFGQRLRRFISARVQDSHVTDELTQELLIKSYKNLDSLKDEERVDAWLFRIARNVINDYYRKKKRDEATQLTDIDGFVDLLEQELPEETVHEELSHCIRPFVDQLPDKYRRALIAVDIEGSSQKELAELLGVSHSTIKSQIQRGRAELRKLFRRCCDFTVDARGNVVGYDSKSGKCESDCNCD